jgi:hypothetical protein
MLRTMGSVLVSIFAINKQFSLSAGWTVATRDSQLPKSQRVEGSRLEG